MTFSPGASSDKWSACEAPFESVCSTGDAGGGATGGATARAMPTFVGASSADARLSDSAGRAATSTTSLTVSPGAILRRPPSVSRGTPGQPSLRPSRSAGLGQPRPGEEVFGRSSTDVLTSILLALDSG